MREELFSDVDFGKYMKWWRFKQIKHYIPLVMEDTKMKEEDVDWWKFKNRILQHNASKIKNISASHVLVFDESMSSFIPRCVLFVVVVLLSIRILTHSFPFTEPPKQVDYQIYYMFAANQSF